MKMLAALLLAVIVVGGCIPQELRTDSVETYDRPPNGAM
jgi:hypothetical protein